VLDAVAATRPDEVAPRMIEVAYHSEAGLAIVPFQDLLGLGSEARMNTPSRAEGNWTWRAEPASLTLRLASWLRARAASTGRLETGGSKNPLV
jgi:4-alpha-glucanotransferase